MESPVALASSGGLDSWWGGGDASDNSSLALIYVCAPTQRCLAGSGDEKSPGGSGVVDSEPSRVRGTRVRGGV